MILIELGGSMDGRRAGIAEHRLHTKWRHKPMWYLARRELRELGWLVSMVGGLSVLAVTRAAGLMLILVRTS
jgi:hypothetical protein